MSRWGDTTPAASTPRAQRGEFAVRVTWTRHDPEHGRIPVGYTNWYVLEAEAREAVRELEREVAGGWRPELTAADIDVDGPVREVTSRVEGLARLRAIRDEHRRTA